MFLSSTRKFFIAVFIWVLGFTSAFSQGCVIDTNNFELISPASEYLPCIERNVPYEATIQIFAIPSIAFAVDSYLITTFLNLPSGIIYSLNPMPCKLYPNNHGCVYLSGTTTDSAGSYLIDYNGIIYLPQGAPSFDYIRTIRPGVLPEVTLKVFEQGATCSNISTGVESINQNAEIDFSVYPNPATNELFLQTNNVPVQQLNIYNTVGTLLSRTFNKSIDITKLSTGIYIAEIVTKEVTVKRRWVKM